MHVNPESLPSYGPLPPEPHEEEIGKPAAEDDGKVKGHWNRRLTNFQKLVFIKSFAEDKVSTVKAWLLVMIISCTS